MSKPLCGRVLFGTGACICSLAGMAAAASDRPAIGDDHDLMENAMIDDEDDLDDDELQQMLQDNEADAGAMTDTANTDWYGPCALTSEDAYYVMHMWPPCQSCVNKVTDWQDCNLYRTSMVMPLHTESALHDCAILPITSCILPR